jgi:hypothetical protein
MNALTATIPRIARLSAARYASTSAGPSLLPVSSLYGIPSTRNSVLVVLTMSFLVSETISQGFHEDMASRIQQPIL